MSTQITYGNYHEAALEYEAFLKKIIHEHGFKNLCDVGGGANPLLSPEFVLEHSLEYTLLDISQAELDKAAPQYQKVKADICAPNYTGQKYDFVFSKMLAEHVVQGQQFHQNIYAMLAPGGIALHFFPTLYALPFLINRSIPEKLANFLLSLFVGRDHYQHSKFPAYYSWCRGPSHRQIQNFEKLGYEVLRYKGFFGHGYYQKIPILNGCAQMLGRHMVKHPVALFTSFAYVVLKKPFY